MSLKTNDTIAFDIISRETQRQHLHLEMIASENFVSPEVLEAVGSVLTNKYAEGYPSKRYYSGCEHVDQAEDLAIGRAKKIFSCDYVNVQPHCGSSANMGVYFSILEPKDKILSMNLSQGGHLTHGSPVNFSGKLFEIIPYGVRKDNGLIDYDEVESLAKKHKPKLIVCGASAYSRIIHFDRFKQIANQVGALLMADMAHIAGLVATNDHPSPVPHCDFVTTTTHKTLRGPRGGMIIATENMSKKIASNIFPGIQGGPLMHVILGKAVSFGEVLKPSFKKYTQQILKNTQALAKGLLNQGFTLLTGGSDNHLVLVDLRNKNITGKDAEKVLERSGIAVNKNMVPYDTQSPFITSGVRIGTPALTTRGMTETHMEQIAKWIGQAILTASDESKQLKIKKEIEAFCRDFPLFKQ